MKQIGWYHPKYGIRGMNLINPDSPPLRIDDPGWEPVYIKEPLKKKEKNA